MKRLQWEMKKPLVRVGLIIRLIIGASTPFVAASIYLFKRYDGQLKETNGQYALILLGMLYFLIVLMILALNIGQNASGFIIDEESIITYSHLRSVKRGRLSDFKLVFFGNPRRRHVSSHCASTPQITKVQWKDINKAKYYPKKRLILLQACFDEKISVFCTEANYAKVEKTIKDRMLLSKPVT